MKHPVVICLLALTLAAPSLALGKAPPPGPSSKTKVAVAAENKRTPLGAGYYFIYQFNQRPELGTNILKVQIFDKQDKKTADFKVSGSISMPSMGSSHDSGKQYFVLSKKNDYLLPIDLVMQGDWEITLVFYRGKTEYARSKIIINL